jgi:hypothetical protein
MVNGNGGDGEVDLLSIIGIILGYSNLIENRQQSAHNDIEKHNQEQEKHILDDLHQQFEKQNELLYYQNTLLHEILNILKGDK